MIMKQVMRVTNAPVLFCLHITETETYYIYQVPGTSQTKITLVFIHNQITYYTRNGGRWSVLIVIYNTKCYLGFCL